jgi:hypothetical protein
MIYYAKCVGNRNILFPVCFIFLQLILTNISNLFYSTDKDILIFHVTSTCKGRFDCTAKIAFSGNPNHKEGKTNTVELIRSTCKT